MAIDAPADQAALADAFDLSEIRRVFATGRTRDLQWRLDQLEGIERLCDEREKDIADALHADLGRPAAEAWLGDIASTKGEAAYARKHLKKWVRRQRQPLPVAQLPGRGWVQYDPLGVVLVIGPWNYPCISVWDRWSPPSRPVTARCSSPPSSHLRHRRCWRG